jgi:predicted nucleic acid-binding Zn ribbon protein
MVTVVGWRCLSCGKPCGGWFCGERCRMAANRKRSDEREWATYLAVALVLILGFQVARVYLWPLLGR